MPVTVQRRRRGPAGPHAELRRDAILGCVPVVQYNPRLGALVLSPGTTEAGRVGGRGNRPGRDVVIDDFQKVKPRVVSNLF